MGNRDRVGHTAKRQAQHTLKEKRAAKREQQQERRVSSKRRRRDAAVHEHRSDGSGTRSTR